MIRSTSGTSLAHNEYMKLRLYRILENAFQALATWSEDRRQQFAYCETCGKNRYTAPPCVGN